MCPKLKRERKRHTNIYPHLVVHERQVSIQIKGIVVCRADVCCKSFAIGAYPSSGVITALDWFAYRDVKVETVVSVVEQWKLRQRD
jgi:hypothetical protein